MASPIAVKRLSAVEVDPQASHQHELHADTLRKQLGFPIGRSTGPFRVTAYPNDDQEDVTTHEGTFTLYDARKRHPTRSEYHLYYDGTPFAAARAGDLLVLFRDSDLSLTAVVARAGTSAEKELLGRLSQGRDIAQEQFSFVEPPLLDSSAAGELSNALAPIPPTGLDYPNIVRDELDAAVSVGVIPTTSRMAALAELAVAGAHGTLTPDLRLYYGLEAETDIYFALEERIQTSRFAELQAKGADLSEMASFVLSLLQSRRSRRGQSLQNHFSRLLVRERVPFSAQSETELGERPDFVVPGTIEYHDRAFPAERLRVVACKTTARERWRQVLNEAARVPEKYLLTVDPKLTSDTVAAMRRAALRPFIPAPIITAHYGPPTNASIGTIAELLGELRAIM